MTFHIGCSVDEDKLDEMRIQFDTGFYEANGKIEYVDIWQKFHKTI